MRIIALVVGMFLSVSVAAECVIDLTDTAFQSWIDARKPKLQSTTSRPKFRSLHRCGGFTNSNQWCRRADYHREELVGGGLGPWQDGYLRDYGAAMYNYMKSDGYDDSLGGHVVGQTVYYNQVFFNDYGQAVQTLAIIKLNTLPKAEGCITAEGPFIGGEVCLEAPDLTLAWAQGAGAIDSMQIQVKKPNGPFVNWGEPFSPGSIGPNQPTYELPVDLQGTTAPGPVRGETCLDNLGRATPLLPNLSYQQALQQEVSGGSVTLAPGETVGGGYQTSGITWPSRICYDVEGRAMFCP